MSHDAVFVWEWQKERCKVMTNSADGEVTNWGNSVLMCVCFAVCIHSALWGQTQGSTLEVLLL